MSDKRKEYNERMEMLETTLKIQEPKRVPVNCPAEISYAIEYAGLPYRQASWTPEQCQSAFKKVFDDFHWDCFESLFTRPPMFYRLLNAKNFTESERGFVQHPEISAMNPDEYDELIEDPYKMIVSKLLPRLYPALDQPAPYNAYAMTKAALEFGSYMGALEEITASLAQDYGVPALGSNLTVAPFDYLADQFRGFTGICRDVRKSPDKVKEALDAVTPILVKGATACYPGEKGVTFPYVFIPLHMAPYINKKMFEEFYWPSFLKFIDILVNQKGLTLSIFFEGDWERFYPYMQDIPKSDKIIAIMEYGDMKKAKNTIGKNLCLQGFYPISLLGYGTKQECIDKAKEVIDIMAPGGGYIFSLDKYILNASDVNPENMRAVNEFVRDYGVYK